MADWKKTNFGALEDRSPPDAAMQWRFARKELGSPELGISRFTYEPSARMPFAHRHREQEEAYVVVGGSGRAKLDDEIVELAAWDVLRVAKASGYFETKTLDEVEKFLHAPAEWSAAHGGATSPKD